MLNRALRLIRVYHDLNLSEASQRVGLSKSYISEMERGHKKVSLDVLQKYSVAFGVPMSSLMLFAEHVEDGRLSEESRVYIADKALKMLEWIAEVTAIERQIMPARRTHARNQSRLYKIKSPAQLATVLQLEQSGLKLSGLKLLEEADDNYIRWTDQKTGRAMQRPEATAGKGPPPRGYPPGAH